ncbi:MAG: RNA 2',3'-cyclic phosphodiesterase [Nitrosomonadales bacterium]|nr:RNA 2',3'-cyclic phosphodiesterase [Nitrosomonadales bacterium]
MTEAGRSARVFFALWPDATECAELAAWQPPLQQLCCGRVMRADTLHVTLVFLGEVAESRLEALKLAAQEVRGERFELSLDTARYWEHNHIVHAAPQYMPPALAALVGELEQRLRQHRFAFERREYKPHVTLLRHAQWMDASLPEMPPVV